MRGPHCANKLTLHFLNSSFSTILAMMPAGDTTMLYPQDSDWNQPWFQTRQSELRRRLPFPVSMSHTSQAPMPLKTTSTTQLSHTHAHFTCHKSVPPRAARYRSRVVHYRTFISDLPISLIFSHDVENWPLSPLLCSFHLNFALWTTPGPTHAHGNIIPEQTPISRQLGPEHDPE